MIKDARIALVAAVTKDGGLGNAGRLPWHPRRLALDMAFLQYVTTHDWSLSEDRTAVTFADSPIANPVVMGRRTWESLPQKVRPLRHRRNIVISRDPHFRAEGAQVLPSLDAALTDPESPLYVLGGSAVYEAALASGRLEGAFVTHLVEHPDFGHDVAFPLAALEALPNRINITAQMVGLLQQDAACLRSTGPSACFLDGDTAYKIILYTK